MLGNLVILGLVFVCFICLISAIILPVLIADAIYKIKHKQKLKNQEENKNEKI